MTRTTLILIAALLSQPAHAQQQAPAGAAYDEALAKRLGADERGMKMYALVMLRSGPKTLSKADNDAAFAGHMKNIGRLADEGKLAFAGPLGKNERYRGIFVLNVATLAEAEALLATDPAVKAGALVGDTYLLYGSAALQEVARIHNTLLPRK